MKLLGEICRDLLHFLIIVDYGAGVIFLVMSIRENCRMASHLPEWRGVFTLRRRLASEYSRSYYAHRGMMWRYAVAFAVSAAVSIALMTLDRLLFRDHALGASLC